MLFWCPRHAVPTAAILIAAACAKPQPAPPPAPEQWQLSSEQLEQLVAPIALYPDALVAQILAASTYPVQIVEAERWIADRPDLTGDMLADAVDSEDWDPSVKGLTQFPVVLAMLDSNLAWTSALGDAYVNQPDDVLDAVQAMRDRARRAGTLTSTPQQTVENDGDVIIIAPVGPDVVWIPVFDPCYVYGAPVVMYPGFVTGCIVTRPPQIVFYNSVWIGPPVHGRCCGWRWWAWSWDWHRRIMYYDRTAYVSHTNTFVARRHPGGPAPVRPTNPNERRPAPGARDTRGTSSGAFSGQAPGGTTRRASDRGKASAGSRDKQKPKPDRKGGDRKSSGQSRRDKQ